MAERPLNAQVQQAAAAAQAATQYEATGQLQEAAGQYEVAARGLLQAVRSGSLPAAQLESFRVRASQYMDRIEAIRSGSVLPHEPPPAPQSRPCSVVRPGDILVVPGEYSPAVRLEPEVVVVPGEYSPLEPEPECDQVVVSGGAPEPGARQDSTKIGQRRFHILHEILNTERTFVRTLHELLECYYKPIHRTVYADEAAVLNHGCYDVELPTGSRPSEAVPPTLSAAEFNVLFHPSLLQILPCQVELLRKLESAWSAQARPDAAVAPDFAQQFEEFLPQLVLYTDYIGNYRKANALHSSLAAGAGGTARREQLAAFERSVERAGAAPLSSSLITPVQRLTRYEMLFKELLQHTTDADQRARAERVISAIAAANTGINETLRAQSRVTDGADLLGSLLHPPPPISVLARVGEGEGLRGLQRKCWVVRTIALLVTRFLVELLLHLDLLGLFCHVRTRVLALKSQGPCDCARECIPGGD